MLGHRCSDIENPPANLGLHPPAKPNQAQYPETSTFEAIDERTPRDLASPPFHEKPPALFAAPDAKHPNTNQAFDLRRLVVRAEHADRS